MADYKEPWNIDEDGGIFTKSGDCVARMQSPGIFPTGREAERIVACVNFCAGVSNDMLSAMVPLAEQEEPTTYIKQEDNLVEYVEGPTKLELAAFIKEFLGRHPFPWVHYPSGEIIDNNNQVVSALEFINLVTLVSRVIK